MPAISAKLSPALWGSGSPAPLRQDAWASPSAEDEALLGADLPAGFAHCLVGCSYMNPNWGQYPNMLQHPTSCSMLELTPRCPVRSLSTKGPRDVGSESAEIILPEQNGFEIPG